MPALLELQRELSDRLMAGTDEGTPAWIETRPREAAERLEVYRATMMDTLVRALRLTFPTVHRLVGDDFFQGTGRIFAQKHLPASADLNRYGNDFPGFLQEFSPCAALVYLPDVARLDWAVARALHARDAQAVEFSALAAAAGAEAARLRFIPHPSISLLRSPFPIDAIWRAVLAQDDAAMAAVDLESGPVHLIIERVAGSVDVVRMPAQEWTFSEALLQGRPLADLLEAPADIDVPALLAQHFTAGRVVSFATDSSEGGSP